jgi:predicted RNA-binding Zn-ribbon protein involved in translation (DUF1610 family)
LSIWICPNLNCKFDKELQPNQACPLCGSPAGEFAFNEVGDLIRQKLAAKKQTEKAEQIKRVSNHVKYCPRCGSTKVFWGGGLPQLWSVWECKNCGYKGALILEDGTLGQKLQEEWKKQ